MERGASEERVAAAEALALRIVAVGSAVARYAESEGLIVPSRRAWRALSKAGSCLIEIQDAQQRGRAERLPLAEIERALAEARAFAREAIAEVARERPAAATWSLD